MRPRLTLLRRPAPELPPARAAALAKAERLLDLGWAVAALWALMRLVGAVLLGKGDAVFEAAYLVDPALVAALAYGLYRRSRVCAGLLLLLVAAELYLAYAVSGRPAGLGLALILELSFLTGLRGAVLYHQTLAEGSPSPGERAVETEEARRCR